MLFGAKQAVTVLATTEQEGSRPSWPQHEIPLVGVRQVRSGSDMPTIAVPKALRLPVIGGCSRTRPFRFWAAVLEQSC